LTAPFRAIRISDDHCAAQRGAQLTERLTACARQNLVLDRSGGILA
jgi:hypothetical protein